MGWGSDARAAGNAGRIVKGGRGKRDAGKSPISVTSYVGKHGAKMTDAQIKKLVAAGELTRSRGKALLQKNAAATKKAQSINKAAARAAQADNDRWG